jgi:hypothetical protein
VTDKISIAALVLSAIALLIVLMSSAPEPPKRESAAKIERIQLMVTSESNAAAEEQRDLEMAVANIAEMRGRFDAKRTASGTAPADFATSATSRELGARWKEFDERMSVIRNIRKSSPKE